MSIFIVIVIPNSECESSEFSVLQQIIWCFNFIAGKWKICSLWNWMPRQYYLTLKRFGIVVNIWIFSSTRNMNISSTPYNLNVGSGRIGRSTLIKASLLFRKLYVASLLFVSTDEELNLYYFPHKSIVLKGNKNNTKQRHWINFQTWGFIQRERVDNDKKGMNYLF